MANWGARLSGHLEFSQLDLALRIFWVFLVSGFEVDSELSGVLKGFGFDIVSGVLSVLYGDFWLFGVFGVFVGSGLSQH